MFSEHLLERDDIHHLFDKPLLQLHVLGPERLKLIGINNLLTNVAAPSVEERRIADPMLEVLISRRSTSLLLLEIANDLSCAEPEFLYRPSLGSENRLAVLAA